LKGALLFLIFRIREKGCNLLTRNFYKKGEGSSITNIGYIFEHRWRAIRESPLQVLCAFPLLIANGGASRTSPPTGLCAFPLLIANGGASRTSPPTGLCAFPQSSQIADRRGRRPLRVCALFLCWTRVPRYPFHIQCGYCPFLFFKRFCGGEGVLFQKRPLNSLPHLAPRGAGTGVRQG